MKWKEAKRFCYKGYLYWYAPEPEEGKDYRVTDIKKKGSDTAIITYNDGESEAEVPLHELYATTENV